MVASFQLAMTTHGKLKTCHHKACLTAVSAAHKRTAAIGRQTLAPGR